ALVDIIPRLPSVASPDSRKGGSMHSLWSKWFRRPSKYGIDRKTLKNLEELERKIGYRFTHLNYLCCALKHRSCLQELGETPCDANERLEFLGDAVLDLVSSEFFYHHFPEKIEGDLTRMKSVMVSGSVLVKEAQRLDLGRYVFLSDSEERSGGRTRSSILEDTFEALLGAIYLDGGYAAARRFLTRGLFGKWEEVIAHPEFINYKSRLLEYTQHHALPNPIYVLKEESGPDHAKEFIVEVYLNGQACGAGEGHSKKIAEQMAACQAVRKLGLISPWCEDSGERKEDL
ncbi:MAG: ribonuclease III, partial [bacterium]